MKNNSLWLFVYSLLVAFLFGLLPICDSDIWWHLKSGQWILNHGQVPTTDIFSYTAYGKEWIHHEWLSGVIFWLVFSAFKIKGLNLVAVIVYCFFLYVAGRTIQFVAKNDRLPLLSLFVLASLSYQRVMSRPHVFSLFFYALLLYLLHRYSDEMYLEGGAKRVTRGNGIDDVRYKKSIWFLPLLFLTWANLHAGVLLGLGFLGLAWLGHVLENFRDTTNKTKNFHTPLFWISVLSGLAMLINPTTYRIFTFPFEHFGMQTIMTITQEFKSPFHPEIRTILPYQEYMVLLFIMGLFIVITWKKFPFHLLLPGVALMILSIKANRFTAEFSLWAVPMVLHQAKTPFFQKNIAPFNHGLFRHLRWFTPFFFLGLIVFKQGIPSNITFTKKLDLGFGIKPQAAAVETVQFLEELHLDEKIFNDVELGGYLILAGFPVYIDLRTPVYGDAFLVEYEHSLKDPKLFEALRKKWGFSVLLLSRDRQLLSIPLHAYLMSESSPFALVALKEAYLFLERKPEYESIIKQYEIKQSPVTEFMNQLKESAAKFHHQLK